MKITILGHSGCGKSTLARQLAGHHGIPFLHLDSVQFTAGWEYRDRDEANQLVADFLKNDSWVIEGNYMTFHMCARLEQADVVLFLDFNRFLCLYSSLLAGNTETGMRRISSLRTS
eukprot:TRINITY_DN14888_c0_g1_i1.p3 TRINITY_DN14888_c0_g1~~TRINITY_DN14888_c0_g1_i1.p3  ORF type:complete len:116 (+),score=11.75 TRINITY_DN14888_c0_g1_i1:240-587(+)